VQDVCAAAKCGKQEHIMKNITKDQFVALLKEAGVTQAQMKSLHTLFEKRHPEQHETFLANLGISKAEIAEIRKYSAS
jgi:hypothetical protein